jgi:tetratricopeptide (TPR) repeat protein
MGKNQTISKRLEQVDLQKAELAAINRLLVVSEGTFSLSIAVCNSPALRDHIVEKIKTNAEGITVIKIVKEVKDIFEFVKGKTDSEMPSSIFIVDIEKAIPDSKDPKILRALNVTRELWKANYSCPIVFWVPEYVATLISKHAPDLWSWVSHHFEFVSEQAGAISGKSDIYAGDISLAGSLDLDEKQFRIAELEQRIKDAGETLQEDIARYVVVWLNELGYIYYTIGELDKAEEMFKKALKIDEKLGRLEGMAIQYNNLGVIYKTRGELDKAEEMHNKALEIAEKLGWLEGMASQYGNLGLIYQTRGELDKAEEMHNKALDINKKLGRLEGIAIQYGNLGVIYQTRGELDKSEEMYNKALDIAEKLGLQEIMESEYGNLGVIYGTRGDLDKAEEIFNKALEIDEKLGLLEGMARDYGNLGMNYKKRGDTIKARQFWEKARDLYKKIGMPHEVKKMEEWIEGLDRTEDRGRRTKD